MRELRNILDAAAGATEAVALGTIVATTGSSYRGTGARMLVLPDGRTVGSLSGGCLEEEVAARALLVIASGKPELFWIDTRKLHGCNGAIQVFLERLAPRNPFFSYLRHCIAARATAHVQVDCFSKNPAGSLSCDSPVISRGFEEFIPPPVRLLLLGIDPGAPALICLSQILGWDVAIRDAIAGLEHEAEPRTAAVIGHHQFARDFLAMRQTLGLPFGYVGLLGSRRRRRELLDAWMAETGLIDDAVLENFHAPAGLALGAETPEEIALSIVAEIQAVMTRHDAGSLRARTGPIHRSSCHALASSC